MGAVMYCQTCRHEVKYPFLVVAERKLFCPECGYLISQLPTDYAMENFRKETIELRND